MFKLILVGFSVISMTQAVFAQGPRGAEGGQRACDQSIRDLCTGSYAHGPSCLKSVINYKSLVSTACLADIEKMGNGEPGGHRGTRPNASGNGDDTSRRGPPPAVDQPPSDASDTSNT
jgi:hypothetical protein